MVPIDTEVITVQTEITTLLIRKCQNAFSIQTCQWNSNVGAKISFGGTENASTGCLIEVSTPQITGIRFTAVKRHSDRNSSAWVLSRWRIRRRLVRGDRSGGSSARSAPR